MDLRAQGTTRDQWQRISLSIINQLMRLSQGYIQTQSTIFEDRTQFIAREVKEK